MTGTSFLGTMVAGSAVALAIAAAINRYLANKAERDNPPTGRFVEVGGIRLHYLDRGSGEPVILLHGNGSMVQDFESSGLIDLAARRYRVIAFDRPGFGHSTPPPRRALWTPEAQADLICRAVGQIGISRAAYLGHSWGASVALAVALKQAAAVTGLVLASGYYYPPLPAYLVRLSGSAVPVLGDILSYTVLPIIGRLLWPRFERKIFDPAQVPEKFRGFPKEMALRPSQLRVSAEELTTPSAFAMLHQYAKLQSPVIIVAGDQDRLVDTDAQSVRLHREVQQSELWRLPNTGHMVHQTATARVMQALDEVVAGGRGGK